jgi:hypothetical protein
MRTPRPQSAEPYVEPAEDAASQAGLALAPAVEAIARELRQRHVEQRQAETNEATATKVAKWRRGKFCPLGGRHKVKVTPC